MIKSRRMSWAGHVAGMRRRAMHIGYWWETRRKETTRKSIHRWVDNIKMDLGETGWGGMDCNDLDQDRDQQRDLVNPVMNLRVP
jgi:hypothetical protein